MAEIKEGTIHQIRLAITKQVRESENRKIAAKISHKLPARQRLPMISERRKSARCREEIQSDIIYRKTESLIESMY